MEAASSGDVGSAAVRPRSDGLGSARFDLARIRALRSTALGAARHIAPCVSRYRRDAERRLEHVLGLSPERAARAVDEVLDSLSLDVDGYIAERHAELQREGVANPKIYERIARELSALRFKAPALSARQIRRRIYG